jgi:hypothetical protein
VDDNWRIEDYALAFPDSYYEGPWVDAPLIHKVSRVGSYLAEVLKSCRRCLNVDGEIPAVIGCLAAVDYIAGFWAGRESQRSDYMDFMRQYFPIEYAPLLEQIYVDLRCGLVHNLVPLNPWRTSKGSFLLVTNVPNHLAIEGDRVVWSIATFVEHTRRSWIRYQHRVVMAVPPDLEAVARFHARFDRLAGCGAFMERVPDPH